MENWRVYWLRYRTGDSTCRLRDDSSGLIYCTKYPEGSTLWRDIEEAGIVRKCKETKRSWWNASSRTRWKQVESAGNYCIVQELGSVNLPSYPCRHVRASDLWCRRRRDVKVSTFILSLLSILFILISILYILSPNALTCLWYILLSLYN